MIFAEQEEKSKRRAAVTAAAVTALLCVFTAFAADYYYDLNDDVLMKDIMAGILSGTPTGYNIQMLYPISVFIAFFYRLFPRLPWYGIFLCTCQWGSIFLLVQRGALLWGKKSETDADLKNGEKKTLAVLFPLLTIAAVISLLFRELVFVQYTVTCAFLVATAVFLLYTSEYGTGTAEFVRKNIPAVLLLIIAFNIRTELFLLMMPFLGIAAFTRFILDILQKKRNIAAKTETAGLVWTRYFILIVCLAAGMAAGYAIYLSAYGSAQWEEFRRFFDARTEIYDFYGVPAYEGNEDFYAGIGMTEAQWKLLDNYNFGFDETLDAQKMEQIADFARERYYHDNPWQERAKAAVWEYAHRMLPLPGDTIGAFVQDMPWNVTVLLLYASLIVTGIVYHRKEILWQLPLMAIARTISWGYILFRGRVPIRISHSLYLTEALTLTAFLCVWHVKKQERMQESRVLKEQALRRRILRKEENTRRRKGMLCLILPTVLLLFLIGNLPFSVNNVLTEQKKREEINRPYEELKAYCRENEEDYYYVDVRSTVYFSEKMFAKVDNTKRNYDIIGGWACKSPVAPTEEPSFFITESGKEVEWLQNLLVEQNRELQVELKENIGAWDVYWIR